MTWAAFLTKPNTKAPEWQQRKHSVGHTNSESGVISRFLHQYSLMGDSSSLTKWFSSSSFSDHGIKQNNNNAMMVEPTEELSSSSYQPEPTLRSHEDTLDTSLNSSSTSHMYSVDGNENMEVEIVFDSNVNLEKTAEDSASVSSQVVLTDHWDPILSAAMQQDDSQSTTTSNGDTSSSSSDNGSSSSASSAVDEDEINEWTDLTKYPQILQDRRDDVVEPPKATVLSEKLQAGDYQAVEKRIFSHPQEVYTMIAMPKDPQVQGYPLHLACALRPLPPLSIFQLLLSVYPKAARQAESKWGMLPLHFASNLSVWDINHARIVETLLSVYEDAKTIPELCQGQTPLHLAAASTPQTLDGMIPNTSYDIIKALMPTKQETLWTTDLNAKTAQDIAIERVSRTTCHGESGWWKFNPLWELKRHGEKEEDATSVTMSISSGSFTTGSCITHSHTNTQDGNDEGKQEEDEAVSVSDDDTFFTARSHEQSTVQVDNTHASAAETAQPSNDNDRDEVESILTVEQDYDVEDLVPEPPALVEPEPKAFRPFIPRAIQVDKVLLQLQIQVSELIRPRNFTSKAFRSLVFPKTSVNPYYEVELLHAQSDTSVSLHKSEAFFQRRNALWEPIRFTIDASIAKAHGMVLSINMYHKQQGKSKEDEWIGGHQASPWELNESVKQIPLQRDQIKTGKVRLVSYKMVPLDRADCWRIFM